MEDIIFILIFTLHIIVNVPNLILLLIGFFKSFSRTIQKSSKIFLGLGMLFLLLGLVPTILLSFGMGEVVNNYSFGYSLYLASLFSGDIAAFLLLGISFLREYSLLVSKQKKRWVMSLFMLLAAWAFGVIGVFIPNWGGLLTMLFMRWVFGLFTCIMLLITLGSLRIKPNRRTKSGRIENISLYLIQAQTIRADLVKLINGNKQIRRELGELEPLLDKSVSQIKLLVRRHQEVLKFMKTNPSQLNEKKIKELEYKENSTSNELMKKEFRHAIEEHRKSHQSMMDLHGQTEIIELRVTSAVASMEKLRSDALQMKNIDHIIEPASLKELREKTEDTSAFIKDYKEAFKELDNL